MRVAWCSIAFFPPRHGKSRTEKRRSNQIDGLNGRQLGAAFLRADSTPPFKVMLIGAIGARAKQFNACHQILCDFHQPNVPTVGLQVGHNSSKVVSTRVCKSGVPCSNVFAKLFQQVSHHGTKCRSRVAVGLQHSGTPCITRFSNGLKQ